jgi:solute carrier family 25 protein 34/35
MTEVVEEEWDIPKSVQQPPAKEFTLLAQFLQGSLASCGAVTVSNPFELIKTRLQIQGELKRQGVYVPAYRGMLHAMLETLKREGIGITGLQKVHSVSFFTSSPFGSMYC